jgi:hypothetical protein
MLNILNIVEGHEEFAKSVLPRFYKHNTFASFVRQLNMYDFHKIPHIQQGALVTSSNMKNEVWEFSNPHFQRNRPDLLVLVTRKRNRDRDDTADAGKVNLGSLVKDITAIRKHQTNITADLRNFHRDNEIIWKETLAAREKHQKHQQIISKILQFLTVVFSNEHHQLDNIMVDDQQIEQQQQPSLSNSSSPPIIYQKNNINQHHRHQQNNYYILSNHVHNSNSGGNSSSSDSNAGSSGDDDDGNNNISMTGFSKGN